jgi:hypothetical protein
MECLNNVLDSAFYICWYRIMNPWVCFLPNTIDKGTSRKPHNNRLKGLSVRKDFCPPELRVLIRNLPVIPTNLEDFLPDSFREHISEEEVITFFIISIALHTNWIHDPAHFDLLLLCS